MKYESGFEELFDLQADPHELHNAAGRISRPTRPTSPRSEALTTHSRTAPVRAASCLNLRAGLQRGSWCWREAGINRPVMTEHLTKERVLEALKRVKGPDLRDDIVSLGLVSEVVIHKGKVYFAISVDPARAGELEALREAAEKAVSTIPEVEGVAVTLTADRSPGAQRGSGNGQGAAGAQPARHAAGPSPSFTGPGAAPRCAASPRWPARRRQYHCGRLRQGRRRQVDHCRKLGVGAERARVARGTARRRHLRPIDAAFARTQGPAATALRLQA